MLFEPYGRFHMFISNLVAAYWEIASHSAYGVFSKYLIINYVFPTSVFWSRNFFLISPFPEHCLLVPCYDGPYIKRFILVCWDRSFLSVVWPTGVQQEFFSFAPGVS